MPITPAQAAAAEAAQSAAAQDPTPQVRLIAGPGTGKSAAIERRVAHVLNNGADPNCVFVISFTRATCAELTTRIAAYCADQPCAPLVGQIYVSTMHSLALRLLRSAAVLATLYPSDPIILDDWETSNIYDAELANELNSIPTRATEVRAAHDAQWQTLDPQSIAQAAVSNAEINTFNAFHATRRNLYSCVLPGEVIYECVTRIQLGAIQLNQLPRIEHLIVDEYQDLNACDQEFVRLLTVGGATLFVAGDDDQSIYSFRHANPVGIVQFSHPYPGATTHTLNACFRCSPAILNAASALIAHNPARIPKPLLSLYANATPPVQGVIHVWSFPTESQEIDSIAQSCRTLINSGMAGQEDQIVILISSRRLQLGPISQALANLGLPFDPPGGEAIRDGNTGRALYSILRLVKDRSANAPDYLAHRAMLATLHGVGVATSKQVGDLCVDNHQNFHDLFYLAASPNWLTARHAAAVNRVRSIIAHSAAWSLEDTLGERTGDIANILGTIVFAGSAQNDALVQEWNTMAGSLPGGMLLDELLQFLAANDEADQRRILDGVNARLGNVAAAALPQKRIRILTMHGAKGLSGKVVFIPSAEQGIMPSFRAIRAAGLLNEQRRLFYVSLTRAKAACILSHAILHTGPTAFSIQQKSHVRLSRSQFLNEMGVASVNRTLGLSAAEAGQIMQAVNNL